MESLTSREIFVLFLSLGILLACARLLGEAAKRMHQPSVLGELLTGIILGPTILGRVSPGLMEFLFPTSGHVPVFLSGLNALAVSLFLLVAGMEVDLSTVLRRVRNVAAISIMGMIVPFAIGLAAAWALPQFLGRGPDVDNLYFGLFFATALSISALPVIAKILLDLNLYYSETGMVIIGAAVINDLAGWIIFSITLSLATGGHGQMGAGWMILSISAFAFVTLTIGRRFINRAIPWIASHASPAGGVIGFALVLALFGAAFTEWIGLHAIFGAFIVGIAIGDSPQMPQGARKTIDRFVSFFFAPLFFACIGLRLDFAANFQAGLVALVFAIACIGKLSGCLIGGALSKLDARRSLAVGFGLNARGGMEIILGLLALQFGLIGKPMFEALVIMALLTSMMSGPGILRSLGLTRPPEPMTDAE